MDYNANAYVSKVKAIPAADVVPARRGQWMRYGEDGYPNTEDTVAWQCDQCLEMYYGRTTRVPNYCPNCGCRMDGGADT